MWLNAEKKTNVEKVSTAFFIIRIMALFFSTENIENPLREKVRIKERKFMTISQWNGRRGKEGNEVIQKNGENQF